MRVKGKSHESGRPFVFSIGIIILGRDHSRVILATQIIEICNFCWFDICVFVGRDHSRMIL